MHGVTLPYLGGGTGIQLYKQPSVWRLEPGNGLIIGSGQLLPAAIVLGLYPSVFRHCGHLVLHCGHLVLHGLVHHPALQVLFVSMLVNTIHLWQGFPTTASPFPFSESSRYILMFTGGLHLA